jgi:UDP-4-amino-4,6-dideoxy-N-acetyl-beta-L-altrosamine transaminase
LKHSHSDTATADISHRFVPYGRQKIDDDDIQSVIEVLQSDWLTQGPKSKEFEQKFADYCGAKYAVSVSSGTAALHLSCRAADIGKGDEVITSPITFAASSNCALYVGATPVFLDIDRETLCIDPGKIETYLKNKNRLQTASPSTTPKAVIPVHFAGLPCDMETISQTARDSGLVIIEDACHAHGARYPSGERVGSCTYSDMTVFSFHPLKNITTAEGGMITTNSFELYEKLLLLRSHGISKSTVTLNSPEEGTVKERTVPDYYQEMQLLGFNYRLNDIQCALGISQLNKLDIYLERRRNIASYYYKEFKGLEQDIILPPGRNADHAWHIYVIQVKTGNRDEVFNKLRDNGIGVQVHYIPVYLFPYYRRMGFSEGLCPHGEEYFKGAITLPIHPSMDSEDMERVVEEVFKATGNQT